MMPLLLNNPVSWLILVMALGCYFLLALHTLNKPHSAAPITDWHSVITVLIAALPMCGLLGTITGLLQVFADMAGSGATDLSAGIADALFTTQLGLSTAVPAWLWQAWLRRPVAVSAATAKEV